MSGRGYAGTGDDVLISGSSLETWTARPSSCAPLDHRSRALGVSNPLSDPVLTIYDSTGSVIASNDNWREDDNGSTFRGMDSPRQIVLESALVLHLPAGVIYCRRAGSQWRHRQRLGRSLRPRLIRKRSNSSERRSHVRAKFRSVSIFNSRCAAGFDLRHVLRFEFREPEKMHFKRNFCWTRTVFSETLGHSCSSKIYKNQCL